MERCVIGGDFEIRAFSFGPASHLSVLTRGLAGTWVSSGRAALALILQRLQTNGVRQVHLPSYLCKSILLPIRALGLEYSFYPVDTNLTAYPDPPLGAAVLLIHYFGWLNPATAALRAEAGRTFHLIEDASQAMLSDWSAPSEIERLILINPRKIGPVPLGGWCNISVRPDEPSSEIETLVWRSIACRLARGAYLADPNSPIDLNLEEIYLEAFRTVETFLDAHSTYIPLPQIVLNIIAGLDWENIALRRRANWQTLHNLISGDVETIAPVLPDGVTPLGYVVRLRRRDEVRSRFAEQRIFCPVHWRLPDEVDQHRFPEAALLSKTCLTLPIDQRYTADEMSQVVEALKDALDLCR